MAKPKRPHSGQRGAHGSQGSQRPGGSAGASRTGAPARTQQPRAAQTTATQATRTAQSAPSRQNTQATQTARTTQTTRATQPTTAAKPATGAQRTTGAAPNRYRPLAAREPQSRGAAKRRQSAQPWWRQNAPVLGAVVTVVLFVAVLVLIAHNASGGGPTTGINAPISTAAASALAPTDPSIFSKVGTGGLPNPFKHVNSGGDFLKGSDGKPEFLYAGAEYCPYCAAERWSMIMALNRFGSFSGLKQTLSSDTPGEVFPDTPTFTFVDAKYTSKYLTFSSVEGQDRNKQALQTPTAQQNQIFTKYNSPQYFGQNANGIPFLSIANQYITSGAGYDPQILANENWGSIAGKLSDPNKEVTKDIVGNANYITAAICQTTNQAPDTVCKTQTIIDIEKKL